MHTHRPFRSESGFTLVELMVAAAVAVIGFAGVAVLNETNLRVVKSARQSNAATLCLLQRAEQLRLADWTKITSADYLKNTLLATAARSSAPLGRVSEKVIVEAYPNPNAAQKLVVQRNADGSRVTLVSGTGLMAERLARVELLVAWTGSDGRPRSRATTTLMSNGGVSRMNLPAFGAAAGSPAGTTQGWDAFATPVPGGTATPAPATRSETPTPTPAASSNGKSRGNVGGKSGRN